MITSKTARSFVMATGLIVAAVLPALAHGRGGPPRGGFGGVTERIHSRGILGQLLFPCQTACASDAETCKDTPNDAAVSCVSTSCATEVATAQTACAADRSSDECEEGLDALRECADECLDTYSTAISVCRETASECRETCEADE